MNFFSKSTNFKRQFFMKSDVEKIKKLVLTTIMISGITGQSFCQLEVYTNNNVGIGTGTTAPSKKLHVEGTSLLNGNVEIGTSSVNRNLQVFGISSLSGNVGIEGNVTIGTSSVNRNLQVFGISSLSGNVGIEGNVTIGTSSANRNLQVFGISSLSGNVGIEGNVTIGTSSANRNLQVFGISSLSGNVGIEGNVDIGTLSANKNLNVFGISNLRGNVGIEGNVDIGTLSAEKNLNVFGNSLLSNKVTIGSSTTTGEMLLVNGNGKFTGDLWVNNTHKIATLSQNQTFEGENIFNGNVTFSGDKLFLMDGPKSFRIQTNSINTTLQIGISEMDRSYHRAAKTGDIVIRRLGNVGSNKKLIISTATEAYDIPAQAVGITGADDESAAGVWAHNNLNVRIGPYSTTGPTHRLEIEGNTYISDNLGIGIAPTHKLHVSGNSYVTGNSTIDGRVGIGGAPSTTASIKIDVHENSYLRGNVGIGVEPSSNTNEKLYVSGDGKFTGNLFVNTDKQVATVNSSQTFTEIQNFNKDVIFNANVGIGTIPSHRLHVSGNSYVSGNSAIDGNVGIGVAPSTDASIKLYVSDKSRLSGNVGIGGAPSTTASTKLDVYENSYLRGNVGIGIAPSSTNRLYVSGNAHITDNLGVGISPSYKLHVSGDTYLNGNIGIGVAPNSSNKLYVSGNSHLTGNLGIGISPSHKLHVSGNSYFTGNSTIDGRVGIGGAPSTTTSTKLNVYENSHLQGNVGIGAAPATERLYVSGTGKFTGDLFVNNTHKVATLSQDQTYTGDQTFTGRIGIGGTPFPLLNINLSVYEDSYFNGRVGIGITPINSFPPQNFTFGVSGNSFFDGNVGIGGEPSTKESTKLNVYENSHLQGNVGIGAEPAKERLYVSGNGKFTGDLWVNNEHKVATLSQNQTFTGNLTFAGNLTFTGNQTYSGNQTFSGRVGIGGAPSTTASTKLNVYENSYLQGNVGIGTAPCPNNKLSVGGNSLLDGNVEIPGNVTIGKVENDPLIHLNVGGSVKFNSSFDESLIFGVVEIDAPIGKDYGTALYPNRDRRVYLGTRNRYFHTLFAYTVDYHTLIQRSDIRLKENIRPLPSMLDKIGNIKTYNYNFIDEYFKDFKEEEKDYYNRTEYGFIAQEFSEIFPELVYGDEEKGTLSINYVSMIPILTAAINELREEKGYKDSEIDELRYELELQRKRADKQDNEIAELRRLLEVCCQINDNKNNDDEENSTTLHFNITDPAINTETMVVRQNAPNPFNVNTTIECYIPSAIVKVQLCVYDMQGIQIKCLDIAERGNVGIIIEAGKLSSGIYTYLLLGDGKTSEAKQMILTK